MANTNLSAAKNAKNDEFYTQYADIQKEVNAYLDFDPDVFRGKTILLPCDDPEWSNFTKFFAQNFEAFGLKKLISTSYAVEAKNATLAAVQAASVQKRRGKGRATLMKSPLSPTGFVYAPTLFETQAPHYDAAKTRCRGKIFVLDHDTNRNGKIDIEDLEWRYLEGDGDFRSDEVRKLRDEADIIVTNPPFSLFREFLAWIVEADKKFLIIGNRNALKYKEVFPLIKENKLWLSNSFVRGAGYFTSPIAPDKSLSYYNSHDYREGYIRVPAIRWFTNLDNGRRHQPMLLMSEADNIKYSRHKEIKGVGYARYDNFDAIEVPHTDAIPSDYQGRMGVPISFLDKYCPEQFEILGELNHGCDSEYDLGKPTIGGIDMYTRILIRHRKAATNC